MRYLIRSIPLLAIAGLIFASLPTESADERDKRLTAEAVEVFEGKVVSAVVSRKTGRGDERLEAVAVTISVAAVRKGNAARIGEQVSVKCVRKSHPNGKMFAQVAANHVVPTEGQTVRVYVDAKRNVLTPDGVEVLK